MQLVLSEKDFEHSVFDTLGREGPSESPWFQGFSVTTLNCLPFGLRGLLARWIVSISAGEDCRGMWAGDWEEK